MVNIPRGFGTLFKSSDSTDFDNVGIKNSSEHFIKRENVGQLNRFY